MPRRGPVRTWIAPLERTGGELEGCTAITATSLPCSLRFSTVSEARYDIAIGFHIGQLLEQPICDRYIAYRPIVLHTDENEAGFFAPG